MKNGQEVPKSSETPMCKGFQEGTYEVPQHLPYHFCCLPRKKLFPAQGKSF